MATIIKGFASDWSVPAPARPGLDAAYTKKEDAPRVLRGLGTADDSATISAALNAADVRAVTVPSGATANVETMVVIPANKTLVVEAGATIRRVGAGNGQPVRLSAGSTLEGSGTIDAASLSSYTISVVGAGSTIRGVRVIGSTAYGIGNNGNADLRVEGCTFVGLPSYALINENAGASGARFTGNRILNGGRGVMMKECTDTVIANNIVHLTTGVGIEVFGSTSARSAITGNVVIGTPQIGISLASALHCAITGNVVRGATQLGIENAEGASHNTITGNTVDASTAVAISVTSGAGGVRMSQNVTVSNNAIRNAGTYGINTEYGRNNIITGNVIHDAVSNAIFCNNNATGYIISGNMIRNTDAGTTGLLMRVGGTGCTIDGNLFDCTSKTTQNNTSLRIEGGARHLVQNNHIRGSATGIAVNNSPGTVLNNNRTDGTTTQAVQFYGAATTPILLTHIYTLASGSAVTNSSGVTVTGPLVQVA